MQNFIRITPFMHVRELMPALDFFEDILGFTVGFQSADYAYVEREGAGIRLHAHDDAYLLHGNRGFRYYIKVNDVDALYAELKAKLDTLPPDSVHGPRDQVYHQRELMIVAPDGDLIVFGQALEVEARQRSETLL